MAHYPRRVIAGIDGSAHSADVLAWAAAEAERRDGELLAVTVRAGDTAEPAPLLSGPAAGQAAMRECRDMQARLLRQLPLGAAHRVTSLVLTGDPAGLLTHLASARDLLVVGTRGRGQLSSPLPGSVALGCAERARCPVIVIPAGSRGRRGRIARGPVVAGVGSFAAAPQVLRFAAEEAAMQHVPLIPLHVLNPGCSPGTQPAGAEDLSSLDSAQAQLEALVRAELTGYEVTAGPVAVSGQPERVLRGCSEWACLVAVGSHQAGRLRAALPGSVSAGLLQHGRRPVAVVPVSAAVGRNLHLAFMPGTHRIPEPGLEQRVTAPQAAVASPYEVIIMTATQDPHPQHRPDASARSMEALRAALRALRRVQDEQMRRAGQRRPGSCTRST